MGRLEVLDRLESTTDWSSQYKEERCSVKCKLQELILKEERAARQKSKSQWAKEGDSNTKLFHRLMNARKSKNLISKIEKEDGNLVKSENEIIEEVVSFFKKLY